MNLGNGDAALALAEMNWNNDMSRREFLRHGIYMTALTYKKPNSDRPWFDPNSENAEKVQEYNALLFGLALHAVKTKTREERRKFEYLNRAVNALTCMDDDLHFSWGALATTVANKLWFGEYERKHEDSSMQYDGKQRPRSIGGIKSNFCFVRRALAANSGNGSKKLPLCYLKVSSLEPKSSRRDTLGA